MKLCCWAGWVRKHFNTQSYWYISSIVIVFLHSVPFWKATFLFVKRVFTIQDKLQFVDTDFCCRYYAAGVQFTALLYHGEECIKESQTLGEPLLHSDQRAWNTLCSISVETCLSLLKERKHWKDVCFVLLVSDRVKLKHSAIPTNPPHLESPGLEILEFLLEHWCIFRGVPRGETVL